MFNVFICMSNSLYLVTTRNYRYTAFDLRYDAPIDPTKYLHMLWGWITVRTVAVNGIKWQFPFIVSHNTYMDRYNALLLIYFIIKKNVEYNAYGDDENETKPFKVQTKVEKVYASLDLHRRNGFQTTTKKSIRMHA